MSEPRPERDEPASARAAAFDADWLALREPVDHRARARELLPPLRRWWRTGAGRGETGSGRADRKAAEAGKPARIVDLGSGTGSNLRYLAPRLPRPQRWILVDRDPELLSLARERAAGERGKPDDVTVRTLTADLSGEGLEAIAGADLVTGSALLDLVSREWLAAVVDRCRASGCAALFALTYEGSLRWSRPDGPAAFEGPDDERVREAVNAHQRRDKGLGPALGPDAAPVAERLFDEAGYRTRLAPSVWELGDADRALALRLLEGWVAAALEERPERAPEIRDWADRRRRAVRAGDFRLSVHHLDLLALP